MRKSNLPASGENLFQGIKRKCLEAEKAGIKLIRLSIGQPSGPALEPARIAASEAIMSAEESMHEYQDNGSPGVPDFAKRFVQAHVRRNLSTLPEGTLDYLPIPGIKSMLGVVIKAMGRWNTERGVCVGTMTSPGYPTPADQCAMNKNVCHEHLIMNPKEGFRPFVQDVQNFTQGDLLMFNFPHNPTSIIATEDYWRNWCRFCEEKGIYIFDDEAYQILSHTPEAVSLADIAPDYPDLNWAVAFSASKAGNFTGWRIGAMVGSPEFMGDIKRVKGNTDSGLAAPLAAGIIDLFENHLHEIQKVKNLYHHRLKLLMSILEDGGIRISVRPGGGFFILCDSPLHAFGQDLTSAAEFNTLMIANTGIVGVPFGKWIRYAVCTTDIESISGELLRGFSRAEASY